MKRDMIDGEELPAYLFLPPSAFTVEPSAARLPELPFHDLSWQDFERLCLQLARHEGDPVRCNRYGTIGQRQHGIDIYARLVADGSYAVYQCKHYREVKPADIRKAVEVFLRGPWKARTKRLVFCSGVPIEHTRVLDEVERQTSKLADQGIGFDGWGKTQLSQRLKSMPTVVDDFFGRRWVELFCGSEVARSLAARVEGPKLAELRRHLLSFYRRLFAQHDPGLPAMGAEQRPPPALERRFVLPDVLVPMRQLESPIPDRHSIQSINSKGPLDQLRSDEPRPATPRLLNSVGNQRMPVEQWLQSGNRLMIIGPAGAGKSTLLRFAAIDLLADEPRLGAYAKGRPGCIPIWVPFAHWTGMIEQRPIEECGVLHFLKSWLTSWGATDLVPLIEQALTDGRLLLLVDGIDEWRSSESAGQALHRLVEFVGKRSVPVICSSRPYGVEQAGTVDPNFKQGQLAPLTQPQQKALATTWLEHWLGESEPDVLVTRQAAKGADSFLSDLDAVSELGTLAQNPLLLMLLARLWLQDATLPENRFAAYERLVDHLCREHPKRRAVASSMSGRHFRMEAADVRQQLAFVAFGMHQRHAYVEHRDVLRRELLVYLQEEGFSAEGARQCADSLLGRAPDAPPILVSASDTHVGFLHRALLEHMAAIWVLGLGFEDQRLVVQNHVADPRWTEVLLSVMHGGRKSEVTEFMTIVESAVESTPLSAAPRILLAELAFGPFKLAKSSTLRAAEHTLHYIEVGSSTVMRQRLAAIAIRGARSERVSGVLSDRLKVWFPGGRNWLPHVYDALARFEPTQDLQETLFCALNAEDEFAQRAAGEAISKRWTGDARVATRLIAVIRSPNRPSTQAASLLALHMGWEDHDALQDLSSRGIQSPAIIIRLVSHVIRVVRHWHANADWQDVVSMLSFGGGLPYGWKDLAVSALTRGWPDSENVHGLIREGISRDGRPRLEHDVVWQLASRMMPADPSVADEIVWALQSTHEDYRVHQDAFWDTVKNGYTHLPGVRAAVEAWIPRQKWSHNYVYRAAREVQSPSIKSFLIERIRSKPDDFHVFWFIAALVDGWSIDDFEVGELVREFALGDAARAANVAAYIPTVLGNAAFERLLSLIRDPVCSRRDFVMRAIASLGDALDLRQVVDAFFSRKLTLPDFAEEAALLRLLSLGPEDERVRTFVDQELEAPGERLSAAVKGYGNRPEFRKRILGRSRPVASDIRRALVDALSRVPGHVRLATEALGQYSGELDPETRAQAAYSYSIRRRDEGVGLDRLTEQLRTEATSYGPHYHAVRQAAACGLLALGRLDILTDATETIGDGELVHMPLEGAFSVNGVLAEHLMKSWDYVTELWGGEAWLRFTGLRSKDEKEMSFWLRLIDWIAPGTTAEHRFHELLESATGQLPPRAITFLARDARNSIKVLDQCLKYLGIRGGAAVDDVGVLSEVTDVLARASGGNESVLQELRDHVGNDFPSTGVLLALCKSWPNSDWLNELVQRVSRNERDVADAAWVELRCSKADAHAVVDLLRRIVMARGPRRPREDYLSPIVKRAQRDEAVVDALYDVLKDDDDLSCQVAAAYILGMTSPKSLDVQAWANKAIGIAQAEALWPSAYDVDTGRVRCLQSIMWNLLGT